MDGARELLSDVWREVCRHIEIRASARNIVEMLHIHMPLELLLVRRYDAPGQTLQTVAISEAGACPTPCGSAHGAHRSDQLRRLLAWGATSQLRAVAPGDPRRGLSFLVPPEMAGEVLVGPLSGAKGLTGALLFAALPGTRF